MSSSLSPLPLPTTVERSYEKEEPPTRQKLMRRQTGLVVPHTGKTRKGSWIERKGKRPWVEESLSDSLVLLAGAPRTTKATHQNEWVHRSRLRARPGRSAPLASPLAARVRMPSSCAAATTSGLPLAISLAFRSPGGAELVPHIVPITGVVAGDNVGCSSVIIDDVAFVGACVEARNRRALFMCFASAPGASWHHNPLRARRRNNSGSASW